MQIYGQEAFSSSIGQQFSLAAFDALGVLLRAAQIAQEVNRDLWDFAVEVGEFEKNRVTRTDLRMLIVCGLATHARETTEAKSTKRTFSSMANLAFPDRTCFVLTERGLRLARQYDVVQAAKIAVDDKSVTIPLNSDQKNGSDLDSGPTVPNWNRDRRELLLGPNVVKRFHRHAPNQEMILQCFQDRGWPERIADPLSEASECLPARRLNDAVKSLNRHQIVRLIRFKSDGEGAGVLWELVARNGRSG